MAPRVSPLVRVPTEPLDISTLDYKFRRQPVEHSDAASGSFPRPLAESPHAGGIIDKHARNFAPVHEPSEADDESEMDDSEEVWENSLKQYLQDSWFPAFRVGAQAKQNFVWPHYRELEVAPGTRKLRTISRIMPYRIHGAACECEFLTCFFGIAEFYPWNYWQTSSCRRISNSMKRNIRVTLHCLLSIL